MNTVLSFVLLQVGPRVLGAEEIYCLQRRVELRSHPLGDVFLWQTTLWWYDIQECVRGLILFYTIKITQVVGLIMFTKWTNIAAHVTLYVANKKPHKPQSWYRFLATSDQLKNADHWVSSHWLLADSEDLIYRVWIWNHTEKVLIHEHKGNSTASCAYTW